MIVNRCEVVFNTLDDVPYTVIVYGPTPSEYTEAHPPGTWVYGRGTVMEVRRVREKYREETGRRNKPWWERCSAPSRFFFTEHLAREGVAGGAGAHGVREEDGGGGEDCLQSREDEAGRSGDDHGAEA